MIYSHSDYRADYNNIINFTFTVIDAMEFVPSGLFEGLLSSFGLYEECLSIESPMVKWNDIRGKYCLAKVYLPFMNPSFPEQSDLEFAEGKSDGSIELSKLSNYAKKKALFERLNVNFEMINNKLKLLQMINMLNGSYYRVGLCFPSTCSSSELEQAINKCKCRSIDMCVCVLSICCI